VPLITIVDDTLDGLVHPSVQGDAEMLVKHRAFILPRLLGGIAILAGLPAYLLWDGSLRADGAVLLAWPLAALGLVLFLSRTGRYETAHTLSSVVLAAMAVAAAIAGGGLTAFAGALLAVIPFEAALSGSRRAIRFAVAVAACVALGLIAVAGVAGEGLSGSGLGLVCVIAYVCALALGSAVHAATDARAVSDEDRYRLLASNMSDVISRHGRNGAINFISPAAATVLGAGVGELLGHGLFERVHVADRPAYLKALADAAHGDISASAEFRIRRELSTAGAGADFVWLEMRCRPLEQHEGQAPEVVAVMHDITGRKLQEDALEAARADAERADAAKGRFLATMSHELRTPLNAIIGFSEMLTRDNELPLDADRRREYARLINESGHHLLSVVNGILDMSKIESGNFELVPEPFSPREAVGNCCDLMALKARDNGVDLSCRAPETLPQMMGDKRAFKQILLNLLSNAVKFTGRGGRVTVSVVVEGASLMLSVEDTGVGIGSEDLKRIGDPFFQAGKTYERRHEGTGLGLSIVKGLVSLHGGSMRINSRVDTGTTVTVQFPLNREGARKSGNVAALPTPREIAVQNEQVKKRA
jgi:cell cycle sensor histidine kinase DivJ